MFVYIVAACLFLFYFSMIPLKIAVLFRTGSQPAISSGAGIFEGRFALRRALRARGKKPKKLPGISRLSPALRAGRYLLPRVCLDHFSISGEISLPDAAATALICGAGRSLQAACASLGSRITIDLIPDFSASGCDITLEGMISVRLGHIISAALLFAFELLKNLVKERFAVWKTGIPLKTSCTPPWRASAI